MSLKACSCRCPCEASPGVGAILATVRADLALQGDHNLPGASIVAVLVQVDACTSKPLSATCHHASLAFERGLLTLLSVSVMQKQCSKRLPGLAGTCSEPGRCTISTRDASRHSTPTACPNLRCARHSNAVHVAEMHRGGVSCCGQRYLAMCREQAVPAGLGCSGLGP